MAGIVPTLSEVISTGIESVLDEVFVARPGKVTAYDPLTNTVVVKPAVKHAVFSLSTGERTFVDMPEIPFVPVVFPRAGDVVLRLPVKVGDSVLLVFCDVGLAEWRENGDVSESTDARRHSVGWPVAILGLFPDVNPPSPLDGPDIAAGGAIFGVDGGNEQMLIGGTMPGIRFGKLAISPIALAIPTNAGISGAIAAVNALTAAVTTLITAYNGHTHAVATTGTAVAQAGTAAAVASPVAAAPAGPSTPASVASLLVKSL